MDTKALQLTPTLCADDLLAIAELYIEAFPAVERRPMRAMVGLLSRDECHFHRIMRGDDTVGLMHLWDLPTVCLCEHFAVQPDLRGHGIGEWAMHQVMASTPKPIVVEVEPPTSSITARRIQFYERLGFSILTEHYLQPPYDASLPPVPLYLMSSKGLGPNAANDVASSIHRIVYGRD